jgi:hypothetical protein
MMRSLFSLAFLIVAISSASAESAKINPGKYVRDNDTGRLTIQKNKKNELHFSIVSFGVNCHSCSASGVIRNGVGHADSWHEDEECLISFSAQKSSIDIEPITHKECRGVCGHRADFAGSYVIPPAACTGAGRQSQRNRFLALYRSRQYSQAANTLETLIAQCSEFMHWIEVDQVRNDLALSRYHNNEASQCLDTLNGTLAAKVKNEAELISGEHDTHLSPCDFESYIGLAKAIWFNRSLCSKAQPERK